MKKILLIFSLLFPLLVAAQKPEVSIDTDRKKNILLATSICSAITSCGLSLYAALKTCEHQNYKNLEPSVPRPLNTTEIMPSGTIKVILGGIELQKNKVLWQRNILLGLAVITGLTSGICLTLRPAKKVSNQNASSEQREDANDDKVSHSD